MLRKRCRSDLPIDLDLKERIPETVQKNGNVNDIHTRTNTSIDWNANKNKHHNHRRSTRKRSRALAFIIFLWIAIAIIVSWCRWPWTTPGEIQTPSFSTKSSISNRERDECGCYPHDGTGARIAYLITLHNQRTLQDCLDLVKAIAAPRNIIFIHIDRKLSLDSYQRSELKQFVDMDLDGGCRACGATTLVDSKFDLEWGAWSMNLPTHWSMTELASNPDFLHQWDVFINLSADTLPVYTPQLLSNYFDPSVSVDDNADAAVMHNHPRRGIFHNINFVTSSSCATGLVPTPIKTFPSSWHKRKHYEVHGDLDIAYTDEDGTPRKAVLDIHFGSQWMILTPGFVKYIASSLQREDSLASKLKHELMAREVLMTDETFLPTILANHESFKHTMPNSEMGIGGIQSIRYERMDENLPDAFGNVVQEQRYDVPESSDSSVPRKWGPYFLGVYDLGSIKDSGALFIRKVAKDVDPNMFHIFPVSHPRDIPSIYWPNEVKVSERVDWGPILEYTKRMREG
jgi:hypothetical protein